jgi:monoamine oxidase
MAGLTAAYELRRRGGDVRVVEARARIGGRVHTIRNSFQHDQYAEAGGELIEEEHAAVQELARRLRLSMEPALKRGFGQYIARRDGRGKVASESTTWEVFERYFARACDEYARAEYAPDSPITRAWARLSLDDALRRAQAPASARRMAMALRGFFLAEPEELSLLMVLDQLREGGDPARLRMMRIAGGNDRLAAALAKAIGISAISLRHEAIAITQNSGDVRVTIKDGHGTRTEAVADYAIVTVPAPIVRRIKFLPHLPDPQQHAIDALVYGRATKTLLQFARPFWRRRDRRGVGWIGTSARPRRDPGVARRRRRQHRRAATAAHARSGRLLAAAPLAGRHRARTPRDRVGLFRLGR